MLDREFSHRGRSVAGAMPQRPIAAALFAARLAEIGFLDFAAAAQLRGGAFQHHAPVLQDVAVIGDLQRHAGVLLNQQNGDAELLPDAGEPPRQIFDHHRRQAERELVHQQQFGVADNGAAERKHLALAARQQSGEPRSQLRQRWKELEDKGFEVAALGRHCRATMRRSGFRRQ